MRFVAGRGAVAERCREAALWRSICWPGRRGGAAGRECHGEEDGGAVAESHREAFAGQGAAAELHREAATAGKGRYCWKGEQLPEIRTTAGKESHCQKGEERSATAGKKGLQGATGWSLFLMRPLCKLFLYL